MINLRLGLIEKICKSLQNNCTPLHKIAHNNSVNLELVYLVNNKYNIRKNVFTDMQECMCNIYKTLDYLNCDLQLTIDDRIEISHLSRYEYYKFMKQYGIMHASDRRKLKLEEMIRSGEYTSFGIAKRLNVAPEYVNNIRCKMRKNIYSHIPKMPQQKAERMYLPYEQVIADIHKRISETVFVDGNVLLAMKNKPENYQSKLIEKIIKTYLNTEHNDKELSEICNCTRQQISLARKIMRVPSRSELRRLKIRDELMNTSRSLYDIAEHFSVSMPTVRSIVKKFNIKHRM